MLTTNPDGIKAGLYQWLGIKTALDIAVGQNFAGGDARDHDSQDDNSQGLDEPNDFASHAHVIASEAGPTKFEFDPLQHAAASRQKDTDELAYIRDQECSMRDAPRESAFSRERVIDVDRRHVARQLSKVIDRVGGNIDVKLSGLTERQVIESEVVHLQAADSR